MARLIWLLLILVVILTHVIFLSLDSSRTSSATLSRSPAERIEQALVSVEEALDAVEEIQTAEDLEDAQDLAAEAEQDLRGAISILEDIEIQNWVYLPKQGALYWHGPILDRATEEPVQAFIYINGHFIAQAQEVQLLMWATEEEPVWVEVRAEGYKPWGLRFRARPRGLEVIEGPVWLVREG